MTPDPAELRRHYASLPDETLLEIDRADLTPMAQRCYDDELANRNIATQEVEIVEDQPSQDEPSESGESGWGPDPDWLSEAVCVCSFESRGGDHSAPQVDETRHILESAGIPCHAVERDLNSRPGEPPNYLYELMVPAAMVLTATSVLDKEYFNPHQEAEWRTHLDALSDEDFGSLRLDDLTAGMKDRIARITAAFNDERARRVGR